jgi:DNA-3-methyladenine glycosylase II
VEPIEIFTEANFYSLCNHLAKKDKALKQVITAYGYPPVWTRPNSFESLVLIILEQQVSLASAYAAYKKLKEKIKISPKNLLQLTDEELRSCYFSRQKIIYIRELATAILTKKINLKKFKDQPNEVVRKELKELKGIGDWTVDIYLIHSLQRADVFPIGDLALVNGIRMILESPELTKEEIMAMAESWRPYRTIATMITWHYYIKKKNINLLH